MAWGSVRSLPTQSRPRRQLWWHESAKKPGGAAKQGKALGAAKMATAKLHTQGGPRRRPARARARQGRRIICQYMFPLCVESFPCKGDVIRESKAAANLAESWFMRGSGTSKAKKPAKATNSLDPWYSYKDKLKNNKVTSSTSKKKDPSPKTNNPRCKTAGPTSSVYPWAADRKSRHLWGSRGPEFGLRASKIGSSLAKVFYFWRFLGTSDHQPKRKLLGSPENKGTYRNTDWAPMQKQNHVLLNLCVCLFVLWRVFSFRFLDCHSWISIGLAIQRSVPGALKPFPWFRMFSWSLVTCRYGRCFMVYLQWF